MQTGSIKRVIQFTVCLLLLGVSTFQPPTGMAQEVENPWSKPVNLSKSGSSLDPSVVVDSTGVVHAIWLDSFDGYIYSEFAGGEWSAPEKVPFPFGERGTAAVSPIQLVNDNRGFIHAFWIGPRKTLYHSFVNETHVSASGSWASSVEIAQFVTGFDIAMDADGNLHLVYVRGRDDGALPAGVYYRQSPDGFTWTSSQPIYLSPYFRSQPEAEVAHHVDISTTSIDDNNRIFVGWDDPASNRASIRRSNDGGETLDEPYDVALAGGNTFG